jgi:CRISPR-associated protein Cas1
VFSVVLKSLNLGLINNRILNNEDFFPNQKDGSVYLKREAMKKYFSEYEKFLSREFVRPETKENTTLRKCFRIQAERLAGHIKGGAEYTPFLLQT